MAKAESAGRTSGSLDTPYPTPAVSVGAMFVDRVAKSPAKEAFRSPTDAGDWTSYTWQQTSDEVMELAAGLIAEGVGLEDRVAIASSTRLHWILADFAIMCAGGANTTVYPNTQADDAAYILSDSDSQWLFAEDQSQVDKVMQIRGDVPELRRIILMEGSGDGDFVLSWDELRAKGRALLAQQSDTVTERIGQTKSDGLATLIYTSGTTGKPKGVELTHGCWTYEAAAMQALKVVVEDDTHFLWLPLSHVFGKVLISAQLQIGFLTVVDGRVPEIINNLPIIQPTIMAAVPRIFEKIHAGVVGRTEEAGGLKLKIFNWAFDVGGEVLRKNNAGESVSFLLGLKHKIANKLVFSKIQQALGGNMNIMISGSAKLNQEIAEWFAAAGLVILEGYGLTETSGATCVVRPGNIQLGTVGEPLPGTQVRIADDGEILIKGPGLMRGYRNREKANDEAFAPGDGWFATGDIGVVEDNQVKITDRKKDLVKTSGGKYIALGAIETLFKAETGLASACLVIANQRNFASALIALDPDAIEAYALSHDLGTTDIKELAKNEQVNAEIQAAFERLNAKLNRWETIKTFRILDYVIDPETTPNQITPSLKIKRKNVELENAELIESMYS
jgi:long-chain acyl-CoA synthetase